MKNFLFFFALIFITFFVSCSPEPDNTIKKDTLKGGTLVVNNGSYSSLYVEIYFDNVEVYKDTLSPRTDVRRSSNKNIEYKIVYSRQNPYLSSTLGALQGGQTIYLNF